VAPQLIGPPDGVAGGLLRLCNRVSVTPLPPAAPRLTTTAATNALVHATQMKDTISGTEATAATRRRLPRCISGDGVLKPFALAPAMGLALLHSSGIGPLDGLVKGAAASLLAAAGVGGAGGAAGSPDGVTDAYEVHLTLPGGNVALITNCRLLMVLAPEFAALETEVLAGRTTHVSCGVCVPPHTCVCVCGGGGAGGCLLPV
jgi:hypothetical protein